LIFHLAKLLNPSSEMLESDEEDDDYEAGDSDEDEDDDNEEGDVDEALAKTVANAIRGVQGESDSETEEEKDSEEDEDQDEEEDEEDDEDENEDDDEDEEEEEIDEMELEKQILSKHKRPSNQLSNAPEPKKQKAEVQPKATAGGVRNLSNGMTIEDLKIGQGEKAKAGKRVRHLIEACCILKID
jgi:FKBP-type peptidyl-prolyl cis-trans isomerase